MQYPPHIAPTPHHHCNQEYLSPTLYVLPCGHTLILLLHEMTPSLIPGCFYTLVLVESRSLKTKCNSWGIPWLENPQQFGSSASRASASASAAPQSHSSISTSSSSSSSRGRELCRPHLSQLILYITTAFLLIGGPCQGDASLLCSQKAGVIPWGGVLASSRYKGSLAAFFFCY